MRGALVLLLPLLASCTGDRPAGLAPPAGVDTLVLCASAFDAPFLARADCAVVRAPDRLDDVRAALAGAEPVPPPEASCTIGAGSWDVIWMAGGEVVERLDVPDATCLPARGPDDGESYAVSEQLLGTLSSVHMADTDPADAPESPGVPFSDLDVLVLEDHAGEPAERLTVRALVGRPDPDRAVGERLLVATADPPMLGGCGFTQPYSAGNAQQWEAAFG